MLSSLNLLPPVPAYLSQKCHFTASYSVNCPVMAFNCAYIYIFVKYTNIPRIDLFVEPNQLPVSRNSCGLSHFWLSHVLTLGSDNSLRIKNVSTIFNLLSYFEKEAKDSCKRRHFQSNFRRSALIVHVPSRRRIAPARTFSGGGECSSHRWSNTIVW